jgi:cell division protein ZipA
MPELRIILLVVGVLFVAGIACFEWWRSRGQRPAATLASRDELANEPPARGGEAQAERPAQRSMERGDKKPLPEINVVREPRMALQDSLPVIELDSTSASGTRRALGISISDEVAVDISKDHPAEAPRPSEPWIGQHEEVSEARIVEEAAIPAAPKLTLTWPSEAERRIVTLRVIPKAEPRFPGRTLRQAFGACGFWHGPLDIYHLPDESGRVLLSAAALAQPGTFDPSIMDSQRFSGLNLFAVLPGPAPEREVFEELVHAARQLAERLDGLITDQHGDELTAARIQRLRQSLGGEPETRAAGQS